MYVKHHVLNNSNRKQFVSQHISLTQKNIDPLSGKKNFTIRAKERKKNWYSGVLEVTYYEFALKIWEFKRNKNLLD